MKKIDIDNLSPAQILSLGYLTVIIVGTILLSLPIATASGQAMNPLDALFTATSATAVTGLIVENTATFFSTFGQVVIMILIQIGGLGLMTMSTLFAFLIKKKLTLKYRLMVQQDLDQFELSGIIRLVRYVVFVTFTIEATGALLLFTRFIREMPVGRAAYYAIFHAVSAFNNAGFDIFGNSLENFTGDITVNLVITALFILGGIGFAVIAEIHSGKRFRDFSLQTKLVLAVTAILIVGSTVVVFVLEYTNPATLMDLSLGEKALSSYFTAVTPRTAGFNTLPTGNLRDSTIFFVIVLMFIGASPGSTGGGIKTTTFGSLLTVLYSKARGKEDIELFKRRLSKQTIYTAVTVVSISAFLVFVITMLLTISENAPFIDLLFEAVSAFGTVGLSTGVTPELTTVGRMLIIITMFAGRVGPLTIAMAIGEQDIKGNVKYPKEKILVG